MQYNIDTYIGDKNHRYILGQSGKKPLIIFGINPSTADDKSLDSTMRKVLGFCEKNAFDSFYMLNLYPKRSSSPHKLDNTPNKMIIKENLYHTNQILSKTKNPIILCCWGNNIDTKSYFKDSLLDILQLCQNYNPIYKAIKINKTSHPSHPLYAKIDSFINFDIKNYLVEIFPST